MNLDTRGSSCFSTVLKVKQQITNQPNRSGKQRVSVQALFLCPNSTFDMFSIIKNNQLKFKIQLSINMTN